MNRITLWLAQRTAELLRPVADSIDLDKEFVLLAGQPGVPDGGWYILTVREFLSLPLTREMVR